MGAIILGILTLLDKLNITRPINAPFMTESNNLKNSNNKDEVSLKELIEKAQESFFYLLRHWVLIMLIGLSGAIIGLIYALRNKPVYNAEYSFVLEDENSSGFSGALGLASQFGIDLGGSGGGGAFTGDNLLELMRSRSIVQQALLSPIYIRDKERSLVEYYIQITEMQKSWEDKPHLVKILHFPVGSDPSKFTRHQDSILMRIHDDLIQNFLSVAKIDKKLSIIKVEVKSTDENFAKYFAEAVVNCVSRFYIETKTSKSSKNVTILQHQTDSVRQRLNNSINRVAQSTDVNPNSNVALQILRVPSQQRQIDVQANSAILTELVKNLEISKLALRRETPLIQAIDKPRFPLSVKKIGKLKTMVMGSILAGILIVLYLLMHKFFRSVMNN